jgi:transcriptional regulator with XRE-family HTH domain
MGRHNTHRGIPALPFCHVTLSASRPPSPAYPRKLESLGDHLRKKRLDLGLLQKDVARMIGVKEETIYNWENNRSSPQLHYAPGIIEFLGYVPFSEEPKTLGERIVNHRRLHGITQEELAHRLGVDPSTLARWERNESQPLKRHVGRLTAFLCLYGLSSYLTLLGNPLQ